MPGEVGILNVGCGDTTLIFDRDNPQEMIRAARIVKDMIRRGYALLISVPAEGDGPPTYRRAYDFDENTCEYIIADLDPETARKADEQETTDEEIEPQTTAPTSEPRARVKKGRPQKTKRVHASDVRSTAVARTAGG